ncbi:MAG: hypothetical protein DSY76_05430 [Bacteroidetes bacterium]|nr:MAG: hypothetical protein DSY76_05430 [Bacteroidota bacterium]
MIVDKNTKISQILKEKPEAIDAIASINRHFKKLQNPFLRKMLAPRVNVAAAAQVGNATVNQLLKVLEDVGFEVAYENENELENKTKTEENMKRTNIVDLDVRPILDSGVDPFNVIMDGLKNLKEGETLKIINTFEPIPLLNIIKKKGYEYETERPEEGVVHTYLKKAEGNFVEEEAPKVSDRDLTYEDLERKYEGKLTEIDVRDLEMPMPMVTILEAIETLEEGHALYVHHKRLPQYLLPELKEREFDYKAQEVDADNMKLIIYRK